MNKYAGISLSRISLPIIILSLIVLTVVFSSYIYANQTTLTYGDGSQIDRIRFDYNSSTNVNGVTVGLGINSYFDQSYITPNVFAKICHPNLEVNSSVDFVYRTFSTAITRSVLNLNMLVPSVYSDTINSQLMNCTVLDVQFSSLRSLYPGYVTPIITTRGVTHIVSDDSMTLSNAPTFNGSFIVNLTVDSPPKSYWFYVTRVNDDRNEQITANRQLLLSSVVSSSNNSLAESVLRPVQILNFTGTMQSGTKFVVNGITTLTVDVFDPCGNLTRAGYYVMNRSIFNYNDTCVNIHDAQNILLNFAGEIIDGDAALNGSFNESICAVSIRNANNITIEGLATQQFRYGICIENSNVTIFGNSLVDNIEGMYINHSKVRVVQTTFRNSRNEINSSNSSLISMLNNSFTQAKVSGQYFDVLVNNPVSIPTVPIIFGYNVIDQYLIISRNAAQSWANIVFNYDIPLPHSTTTESIYIYKFNGTYGTNYTTNNVTNVTTSTTGWSAGVWSQLPTVNEPGNNRVYVTNITSFSLFVPFAYKTPEDIPQTPTTGGGTGGGAGSAGGGNTGGTGAVQKPQINFTDFAQIRLTLPDGVTLMQGEAIDVKFSIENIGTKTVDGVDIRAYVPRGWTSSITQFNKIYPGQKLDGVFSLSAYEKVMPADYFIPVSALSSNSVADTKELKVSVLPRGNLSRLLITEYNPIVDLAPNSEVEITFKAKNIGDLSLEDVKILLAPNNCIKEITGSYDFAYDEEKEITYKFISGGAGNCQYTLKFVEGDKLVDFIPITFNIRSLSFIEQTIRLLILGLIVGVWFIVAVVIAAKKRRPPQHPPASRLSSQLLSSQYTKHHDYSKYYRGN